MKTQNEKRAVAVLPNYQALLFGVACIQTTNTHSLNLVYTDGTAETANVAPAMVERFRESCSKENPGLMPDISSMISAVQEQRNANN